MSNKKRIAGIDVFRIICALGVFFFHTNCHNGCTYGILTTFIRKSDLFMIAFFMMSGFVLLQAYNSKDLMEINSFKGFLRKRLISIMPVYIVIVITNKIIKFVSKSRLASIPAEILGIQSIFPSSLSIISPNDGTWFISCIILCYIIYPYIQEIIKKVSNKTIVVSFVFISGIATYSHLFATRFELDIYRNPFIRILEFILGVLISVYLKRNENRIKTNSIILAILELVLYIVIITIVNNMDIKNYYVAMMNEIISIGCFTLLLITFANTNIKGNKVLTYLSDVSYCFYMSQVFIYCTYNIIEIVINYFSVNDNLEVISISFLLCIVITILLFEIIEKRFKRILR